MSTSKLTSAPPVRRRTPPPLPHQGTDGASTRTTPLVEAGNVLRAPLGEASLRVSRVEEDGSFNGALYSLKAFGIATALVVAGATVSVWGVKTYLGAKDTHEFASLMRLTILDKWPFLISRIHRSSPLPDRDSYRHPHAALPHLASESLHGSGYPRTVDEASDGLEAKKDKDEDWNWPAAQARLAAAYERGGIAQFAEVAVRELEVELELERRKRRIADSVEGPS